MMRNAVLLDTSFFIRFLNESDPLFKNADGYFRYFLEKEMPMMVSTISIAEYCVGGDVSELPLRIMQIVPFNLDHARRTGEFARIALNARKNGTLDVMNRILFQTTQNFLRRRIVKNLSDSTFPQTVRVLRFSGCCGMMLHQILIL